MLTPDNNKHVVERLVQDVLNAGRVHVIDELYTPQLAPRARAWIEPFLSSFSDVEMEIVALVAEGDKVVGRFRCSGTHTGRWLGLAPTGRRFEGVDEVTFFGFREGRIASAWSLEDTAERLRQLELPLAPGEARVRRPATAPAEQDGAVMECHEP